MTITSDKSILYAADAVAAFIELADHTYLLQKRDDKEGVWYPDHWGLFGGAVEDNETPLDALYRELKEELNFDAANAKPVLEQNNDLTKIDAGNIYRKFYVVSMSMEQLNMLELHEGQEYGAFKAEQIFNELRVAPYDAFALFLWIYRGRIAHK